MKPQPLRIDGPGTDQASLGLSRVDALAAACREAIQRSRSDQASRLPPIRQMAREWNISCDTVARAYEQLSSTGWIESRHGSGYYVKATHPARLASIHPGGTQPADDASRLDFLSQQLGIIKPTFSAKSRSGCGSLPAAWLQHERLATKLRELGRKAVNWSDYPDPQGYRPLRQFVSEHVARLGIVANADQVLLTTGASEALQLTMSVLVMRSEGPVLFEDPCSPMLGNLLMSMGLQCDTMRRRPDGIQVGDIPISPEGPPPQAFICSPALHNPTGYSLTQSNVRQLVRVARDRKLLLIEDDTHGDLAEEGQPRATASGGLDHGIYIGSFSKTISPALRCGYVIGTPERIKWLSIFRMVRSLGGSLLSERVLFGLLRDDGYARHCARLRMLLNRHRPLAEELLTDAGLSVPASGNGMYIWAQLPEGVDGTRVAEVMATRGHVLAPGALFSPYPEHKNHMRFNVAETANQLTLARDLKRVIGHVREG